MKYKSFAFIRFENREETEEAKKRLQARWIIMNRRLPIEFAHRDLRTEEDMNNQMKRMVAKEEFVGKYKEKPQIKGETNVEVKSCLNMS